MKTTDTPPAHDQRVMRVWDAPVRWMHWLMAFSFFGAYLTSEWDSGLLVHATLGYTVGGLVVWRLVWGVLGTRYARFTQFVKPWPEVLAHVFDLLRGQGHAEPGHNPLGGWAVVLMLLLSLLTMLTGWATLHLFKAADDLHEVLANAMLMLVLVHVAGVLLMSVLAGQSLVASMLSGYRRVDTPQPSVASHKVLAVVLLSAVVTFWVSQGLNSSSGGIDGLALQQEASRGDRGDGDDD